MQLLTGQREKVYNDRYSLRGEDGKPTETIEQTWDRVSYAIANSPEEAAEFYGILEDFRFVPGGRILAGAGTGTEVTFYNCYVIPVRNESVPENGNDSREAIFDTISRMVSIMSRGGGVGINWSTLRPNGAHLTRINGTTTGPIEWMDVASKAVGAVMQGGSRRGAAMFMINDWHPDVLSFIDAKRDLSRITNANISVAVSDQFMDALRNDADWTLEFPETSFSKYNEEWDGDLHDWIGKGYPTKTYAVIKARDLWRSLAEGAWDNGEPGVIFLDRYNKLSTAASIEKIISVNPCGEQGLGAYSVCNLGAINLASLVDEHGNFEFESLLATAKTAVRFLDNVIDKNNYTGFEESYAQQMTLRRIGLSVMGLADALIKQNLRYGEPAAISFVENVFKVMKVGAINASVELAQEKGAAPGWEPEMVDRPYFANLSDEQRASIKKHGLRNLFLLTQAPTGTTSILAGVNSGIEPYFAFEYERTDRTGTHKVVPKVVEEYKNANPDSSLPDYFVTANDLSVEDHIFMQAAAQKYIDSSVSKTINAPYEQTVDEVEKAYTLAYDAGLKSIAYFRDGCGRDQVLTKVKSNGQTNNTGTELRNATSDVPAGGHAHVASEINNYRRTPVLYGHTSRVVTDVGTAFITVNRKDDNTPCEVFINIGKGGTDLAELSECLGRLISIALQKGVSSEQIREQLFGIGGYSKFVKSLPTAIAIALGEGGSQTGNGGLGDEAQNTNGVLGSLVGAENQQFNSGRSELETITSNVLSAPTAVLSGRTSEACPDCKSFSLNHMEGCLTCGYCGYSRC